MCDLVWEEVSPPFSNPDSDNKILLPLEMSVNGKSDPTLAWGFVRVLRSPLCGGAGLVGGGRYANGGGR
jgi:hypothetical protein